MPRSESEHLILTKRCSDSDLSISNYAVISVFDCNLQSVKYKLVIVVKNAVYSYWNIIYYISTRFFNRMISCFPYLVLDRDRFNK